MQHNFYKAFEDVGARSKSTMKENAAARTVVRQPGLCLCGCSNMQVQLETTFFNQMLAQYICSVKWKGKTRIQEEFASSFNTDVVGDIHTGKWRSRDLWSSMEPLAIQNAQLCLTLLQLDIFKTISRQRQTESKKVIIDEPTTDFTLSTL